MSVLRGDGTGRFGPPTTVASVRGPHALAIGDFEGNGKPDLAALVTNGVAILLGDGSASFHAAPGSPVSGGGSDLTVSDPNGAGLSDLTGGAPYWPVGPRGSVVLLRTQSAPEARPGRALGLRGDAVFATRRQITGLAADGKHAAVCAGGVPMAWTAPGRASVTFKTGRYGCYEGLAVGGDRVAWVENVGCGNLSCADSVIV